MFDLKAHIKTLTEAHGPSGHEAPIRALLRDTWAGYVDEFAQDKLGSLIGIKRATVDVPQGQRRKIMLAAHMDEIALMVRGIKNGFITIHRVAGMDSRVMVAKPVIVHGKQPLPGIIASVPPHLLKGSDRKSYPEFDDLVIDLGLPHEEVIQLVRPGDLITPDTTMLELMGRKLASKAMDDRCCVAAVTMCLDALQGMNHHWDVYAVATVQEESGIIGATTAANMIEPDVAIALDVGFAKQPGVSGVESFEMGGGPTLGIGPNFHDKLNARIKETAKFHEIKVQDEPISGHSGTDAWSIQVACEGIPTALLSIPIRNMHSMNETIDLRDIERTGRLLAHVIAGLEPDFLAVIEWDDLKSTSTEGAEA